MKARAFPKQKAGKWVKPVERGYLMACCDCCLVHRLDFRVVGVRKKRVQFRVYRRVGQTKALRKREGVVVRP